MSQKILCLCMIISLLVSGHILSQSKSEYRSSISLTKMSGEPEATLLNINSIAMWVNVDGRLSCSLDENADWGAYYPRGTAGVVFNGGDGILWGGFVKDGKEPELRVNGQRWYSGTVPGAIIAKGVAENPDDPNVRVWRIRPDWETADLTQEAAEFFNISVDSVTTEQIETVRNQYEKDWQDWPWQKGAPFYDDNNNGIMDEGETPGLAHADQVVWLVVNDLDSIVASKLFGSPPIGLELQITLWAYNKSGSQLSEAFQNVIFKRARLIYKGTSDTPQNARIDSMFIAQFADVDIGKFSDDFAGCDTVLQLGFGYNSTSSDEAFQPLGLMPPSFGYTLLQGPILKTNNSSDVAYFDFSERSGYVNLPMTSFWHKATGTAIFIDDGDLNVKKWNMYKVMNGYLPVENRLEPFYDCQGGYENRHYTKFMVNGDPVAGTGCIDGMDHVHPGAPGERRFQMNAGPFTMALGDTQEVIIAVVGGMGADRLSSVSVMKHYVTWVQDWAVTVFEKGLENVFTASEPEQEKSLPQRFRLHQNYPNPFNSGTDIRYELPALREVKLTVHNLLGQTVRVLVDEVQEAGNYVVHWDGVDDRGNIVPSGVYLYRIQAGNWINARKMMMLQ